MRLALHIAVTHQPVLFLTLHRASWILMEKEVLALAQVIKSPKAPFVAILGA